jgi:hypothetical protein
VPAVYQRLALRSSGSFRSVAQPLAMLNLDGSWDHEFASGGDDLPSYTIEVGMPKVPAFFLHAGVKLNSIALEFTRSGPAAATINAIAQGETRFGTTQGGTPTSLTFSRISQFQGSIKRAGSPVGNLTGGSVTYSNIQRSEPYEIALPYGLSVTVKPLTRCPPVPCFSTVLMMFRLPARVPPRCRSTARPSR